MPPKAKFELRYISYQAAVHLPNANAPLSAPPYPIPAPSSSVPRYHITHNVNVDPSTIKDNQRSQSFGVSGGHEAPKS